MRRMKLAKDQRFQINGLPFAYLSSGSTQGHIESDHAVLEQLQIVY